jgi:CheY-like chemotaxis protein
MELTPPRRILVVEDQARVASLLNEFLGGSGYSVKVAATGEEGLDHVDAFQPDVVVLDLTLPGMMGAEVLDRLRGTHPHVPVIAMTGDPERAKGIIERGAVACLMKPFQPTALGEVVGKVFEAR